MGKFALLGVLAITCFGAIAAITVPAMPQGEGSGYPVRIALAPATPNRTEPSASAPEAAPNLESPAVAAETNEQAQEVTVASSAVGSAAPSGLRLQDIKFDLADALRGRESATGSEVSVTKKLVINGADAGTARILVGRGSQILVSSRDLDSAASGAVLVEGDPAFLSFDQLRDRGLSVRYDPLRDVIEIGN